MRVDFLKNQFGQRGFSEFEFQPIELLDTTQCEGYSLLDRHCENKQIWVHSEIIQVLLIFQSVKQQLTAQ